MRFGKQIVSTDLTGSKTTYKVSGCETREQAAREVKAFAVENGWTPPRWWQWWRWLDSKSR